MRFHFNFTFHVLKIVLSVLKSFELLSLMLYANNAVSLNVVESVHSISAMFECVVISLSCYLVIVLSGLVHMPSAPARLPLLGFQFNQ